MLHAIQGNEWFRFDRATAEPLFGVPGLRFARSRSGNLLGYEAHRSLLPLLAAPEAMHALTQAIPQPHASTWATRDARTAALEFKLRTTQQQALDFIDPRRGVLIGDDMRTGKTLLPLMIHEPADGPLVITAPLSTRGVWLGWARRVFPQFADRIGVATGRTFKPEIFECPIVFAHYDIVKHWQTIRKVGTLAIDEAHLIANAITDRATGVTVLASRAARVICLTGTPIWNMPPNLWMILSLIAPGAWGTPYEFAMRYGAPEPSAHGTVFTGISNENELRARLGEVMLRRRWVDVADDLPPITRSVVVATLTERERNRLDVIAGKLQADRKGSQGHFASYRQQITRFKLPTVIRELQKITGRGEPLVVWTWHRNAAEAIFAEIQTIAPEYRPAAFVIHGDVSPARRDERIAAWQTTTNGVLIATMAVAQAGLDFSHAPIALVAELDYIPATIGQAEMRTYDPRRAMDVIFVVADHIVEQRLVRALVTKLAAADPLGVAAAVDAIDALRDAVLGPTDVGSLDRLLEDMLASAA